MRLALFGGTFDPPHVGHLLAASDAVDTLALDRLVFVPASAQPLKSGTVAPPAARLEMTRRLAGEDPRFEVDAIEIDRIGLSYTVDTVGAYAERYPTADRFLVVGADVIATFPQWREPGAILRRVTLAVLRRGGEPLGELPAGARTLATRRIDVSSTEIRRRVGAGRPIRGFVPDAVAEYIATERLYR